VLPVRGQLKHLGKPLADTLDQNGILALGERLLVLRLELDQAGAENVGIPGIFPTVPVLALELGRFQRLFELPVELRLFLFVLLQRSLLRLRGVAFLELRTRSRGTIYEHM
jgi:hypothetical protein